MNNYLGEQPTTPSPDIGRPAAGKGAGEKEVRNGHLPEPKLTTPAPAPRPFHDKRRPTMASRPMSGIFRATWRFVTRAPIRHTENFTVEARTRQGWQGEKDLPLHEAVALADEYKDRGATTVIVQHDGCFISEPDFRRLWEARSA